jgi:hypothetical protein
MGILISDASSDRGCSNQAPVSMTCATFWATRTSRRHRGISKAIDRLERALAAMEGPAICPSFAQTDKKPENGAVENPTDDAQNSLTEEELEVVARDRIELSTLRFSVVCSTN